MPRAPANAVRMVRFSADHDFTPDHRTIAFQADVAYPADQLVEIFAVDTVDQLPEAFAVHGVPAALDPEA